MVLFFIRWHLTFLTFVRNNDNSFVIVSRANPVPRTRAESVVSTFTRRCCPRHVRRTRGHGRRQVKTNSRVNRARLTVVSSAPLSVSRENVHVCRRLCTHDIRRRYMHTRLTRARTRAGWATHTHARAESTRKTCVPRAQHDRRR